MRYGLRIVRIEREEEDNAFALFIERGRMFRKERMTLHATSRKIADAVKRFDSGEMTQDELIEAAGNAIDDTFAADMMDCCKAFRMRMKGDMYVIRTGRSEIEKIRAFDPSYLGRIENGELELSADELQELAPILRQKEAVRPLEEYIREANERMEKRR